MSDVGRTGASRPLAAGDPGEAEPLTATPGAGRREVLDGVDALLDEIDEVLEDNAEEFVRGYVQKGGQ